MVIHLLTHYTRETNKLVDVDNKCGHRNDLQKGLRWLGWGVSRVDEDILLEHGFLFKSPDD